MARDVDVYLGNHTVQSGEILMGDRVCGRLYGHRDNPLIVVLGGISASRFVADNGNGKPGWWSTLVHEHGPVDLRHTQVLGLDFAPCDQTSGQPVSISTRDQADRLRALLDHLSIPKIASIIGASYGGMVAQAFARDTPERVEKLCIISAAHQPFALGVAWRGIQRRIVRMAIAAGRPEDGMALARELAMTTYRSADAFSSRFDARPTGASPMRFDVCDYLHYCGHAFAKSMSANRFLSLSESIDTHRIEPERLSIPALLIASRTDQLAPPEQMQQFQERLGGPATLVTLDSSFGHDAFLKETQALGPILSTFTKEKCHAA